MSSLLRAFAFGARSLRQKPAYFCVCVLLLAFTTGSLTVMAALVDALVFRPPSARAREELSFIHASSWGTISRPQFIDFRERNRTFSELFAFDRVSTVRVRSGSTYVNRAVQGVSGNFFSALGLPMLRGRGFIDADDRESGPNVIVLTEELSRELRVDVGDVVEVNAQGCTVIGVLPAGYEPLERGGTPQIFVPTGRVSLFREDWLPSNPNVVWLRVVGRRRPGVTEREALADIQALSAQWQRDHFNPVECRFELQPVWRSRLAQDVQARTALLLGGAVVLLFVLACTNLYGLTQLRWFGRRREVALRLALGATRADIAAWRLGELSLVLVFGAALGAVLGWLITGSLRTDPDFGALIATRGVRLGWGALAGTALASTLAVTITWLLGIERLDERQLQPAIKEAASAPRQRRGLVTLLAVELAIALGLVVLCFSFVSTLGSVLTRHLSFQVPGVYYATADVRALGWFNDRPRSNAFYQTVLDRLLAVPGVKAAALANHRPLAGSNRTTIEVDGQSYSSEGRQNLSNWIFVSPDYFEALGIRFRSGRPMTREEMASKAYVAVVNRAFEERFFPGVGAVGKVFLPFETAGPTPIVGVVDDVPTGLEVDVEPQFYLLYTTTTLPQVNFFVQLDPNADGAWREASQALEELWPNEAPPRLNAASLLIKNSIGDLVTALRVATWVALLAAVVVACGVYFFSAFVTAQTLRDSAVRLALGATLWQLAREHVRRYRRGLLGGLALGTSLVLFVFVPMLESLQVALRPPGVLAVVAGAIVLGCIALVGLCAPLWQLRRLDVVSTLGAD